MLDVCKYLSRKVHSFILPNTKENKFKSFIRDVLFYEVKLNINPKFESSKQLEKFVDIMGSDL
jgi:hypothetical protein